MTGRIALTTSNEVQFGNKLYDTTLLDVGSRIPLSEHDRRLIFVIEHRVLNIRVTSCCLEDVS